MNRLKAGKEKVMKVKHTIMMMERDGDAEVTYNNVVGYDGLYGCLIRLYFNDGTTATFDKEAWLMFDLTPTRGWNSRAAEVSRN